MAAAVEVTYFPFVMCRFFVLDFKKPGNKSFKAVANKIVEIFSIAVSILFFHSSNRVCNWERCLM
jgi:hypothetical protein